MHSHCKNKQNKRVFLVVAENIVGSLCVLLAESFVLRIWGVCTPSKHQETTKQTKTINKNKNQEPCQNESFASRYFFLFPSIRSPVLGYQVENASPNHFDPGLPRNLKVANRKVLKKIEDFVSILWTLYEVDVSFVHELLVTARDKHRSYN